MSLKRLLLLAIVAVGYVATAVAAYLIGWTHGEGDGYRAGHAEGLADCEDREAQEGGTDTWDPRVTGKGPGQ